jgi:hypothetical protein
MCREHLKVKKPLISGRQKSGKIKKKIIIPASSELCEWEKIRSLIILAKLSLFHKNTSPAFSVL